MTQRTRYTKADEERIRAEIIMTEAMALSAGIREAAERIEASATFRMRFSPPEPLGRLHPAAIEFATLALCDGG